MTSVTYAARRSPLAAMRRGLSCRCPACGRGRSLRGYLKVVGQCGSCGESLGHIRADDFPPYVTILIVGHLIVPLVLLVEQKYQLSLTTQMLLWPAATLLLTLAFLRPIKGAVLGLMWALRLRGDEH